MAEAKEKQDKQKQQSQEEKNDKSDVKSSPHLSNGATFWHEPIQPNNPPTLRSPQAPQADITPIGDIIRCTSVGVDSEGKPVPSNPSTPRKRSSG